MNKYTRLFISESRKNLESLRVILSGPAERDDLAEGRRLAHSVKGMALFEEQDAVSGLAFAMEKGLEEAAGEGGSPRLMELLAEGVEALREMIDEVERDGTSKGTDASAALEEGLGKAITAR